MEVMEAIEDPAHKEIEGDNMDMGGTDMGDIGMGRGMDMDMDMDMVKVMVMVPLIITPITIVLIIPITLTINLIMVNLNLPLPTFLPLYHHTPWDIRIRPTLAILPTYLRIPMDIAQLQIKITLMRKEKEERIMLLLNDKIDLVVILE